MLLIFGFSLTPQNPAPWVTRIGRGGVGRTGRLVSSFAIIVSLARDRTPADQRDMLAPTAGDTPRLLLVSLVVDPRDLERAVPADRAHVVGTAVADLGDSAVAEAGELQVVGQPGRLANATVQLDLIGGGVGLAGPLGE